jgi:hypothetical protein
MHLVWRYDDHGTFDKVANSSAIAAGGLLGHRSLRGKPKSSREWPCWTTSNTHLSEVTLCQKGRKWPIQSTTGTCRYNARTTD